MEPYLSRDLPGPGTHALIIGISAYEHLPDAEVAGGERTLGLIRLRSAALAAWRVCVWLEQHADSLARPLASIRLLLSPADAEIATDAGIAGAADRASFDNIRREAWAWRTAADDNDDHSIFYFAGHGLGADDKNAILLADDFGAAGAPQFARSFRLRDIEDGMAASAQTPTIAQNQFYFVDACRDTQLETLDAFRSINSGVIFDDLNIQDLREKWIFFATSHGLKANGIAGQGSLFSNALLEAFQLAADQAERTPHGKRWPITTDAIRDWVVDHFEQAQHEQKPRTLGDNSRGLVFRYLSAAPPVDLALMVSPDQCIGTTTVTVADPRDRIVAQFGAPDAHPYQARVPAGICTVSAVDPIHGVYNERELVSFRRRKWPVQMPL